MDILQKNIWHYSEYVSFILEILEQKFGTQYSWKSKMRGLESRNVIIVFIFLEGFHRYGSTYNQESYYVYFIETQWAETGETLEAGV